MTIGTIVRSNCNPLPPAFNMRRGRRVRFHSSTPVPYGLIVATSGSTISVRTAQGIVTAHQSLWSTF